MNWLRIEVNWKLFRSRVGARWQKLTDDDLVIINGKRDRLVGRLQERYGRAREDLEREIEDFCVTCS